MNENETSTVRYELNPAQNEFTVQAFATGFFSGFGHNPTVGIGDFTGEANFSPDALYDGSLRLVINAKSLEGSRLIIEEIPIIVFCPKCETETPPRATNNLCCPMCETPTPQVVRGREMEVTALEIE